MSSVPIEQALSKIDLVTPHSGIGLLVSFEGIDGSGKSTLVKEMGERIRTNLGTAARKARDQSGLVDVVCTRQPGGLFANQGIEKLIRGQHGGDFPLSDRQVEALFIADRLIHVEHLKLALSVPGIILCDRYVDSGMAYAGYRFTRETLVRARDGEDLEELMQDQQRLERLFVSYIDIAASACQIVPDATIYLAIDAKTSVDRIEARGQKFSAVEREFAEARAEVLLATYRELYTTLAKEVVARLSMAPGFPTRRMHVVDATQPFEAVVEDVEEFLVLMGAEHFQGKAADAAREYIANSKEQND